MQSGSKALEQGAQPADTLCKQRILAQHSRDALQAVDHGGMITTAEGGTDLHELQAE